MRKNKVINNTTSNNSNVLHDQACLVDLLEMAVEAFLKRVGIDLIQLLPPIMFFVKKSSASFPVSFADHSTLFFALTPGS